MRLTGDVVIESSIESVWQIFLDPEAICRLAKSCEEARQVDQTHYEGTIRARFSLLTIRARIMGEVVDVREPTYLRVLLEGTSTGLAGHFHGVAELSLETSADGTRGRYVMDIDIFGRLGSLGHPLFQTTAQHLARSFAHKVSRYLKEQAEIPA